MAVALDGEGELVVAPICTDCCVCVSVCVSVCVCMDEYTCVYVYKKHTPLFVVYTDRNNHFSHANTIYSPTTDFLSFPKAQMQCILLGTWNFVKLHLELKYLGSSPRALARLHTKVSVYGCKCTNVHVHTRIHTRTLTHIYTWTAYFYQGLRWQTHVPCHGHWTHTAVMSPG